MASGIPTRGEVIRAQVNIVLQLTLIVRQAQKLKKVMKIYRGKNIYYNKQHYFDQLWFFLSLLIKGGGVVTIYTPLMHAVFYLFFWIVQRGR